MSASTGTTSAVTRGDLDRSPEVAQGMRGPRRTRLAIWLAVAGAFLVTALIVFLYMTGTLGPAHPATRIVVIDGQEVEVGNLAVYVGDDGTETLVAATEPLPAAVANDVQAVLDAADPTDVDARTEMLIAVGDIMAHAARPFIVITPSLVACDGETYEPGYALLGGVGAPPDLDPVQACQMMLSLDGARDLADLIAASDPATAGTFAIFDWGIGREAEIYASQGWVSPEQ